MDLEFFDVVVGYEIALWDHLNSRLTHAGAVSLAVFSALRVVERHDGAARVRELQDGLRITVGSASKFADRLEKDGMVVRRDNPDDRRSSLLELTPLGRDSFDSASLVVTAALKEHLRDAGAVGKLVDALRGLDDALAQGSMK